MSNIWGILSKLICKPPTQNHSDSLGSVELSNSFLNLEFDLVTAEQHKWGAEVTSNPVEDGSTISDHIKTNPDSLEIAGVVSNASLVLGSGQFKAGRKENDEPAAQKAFDNLRKLLDSREPVTIYTRYRHYPDMVLTSLSIPRSPENGDSIEFTANFEHVKRVSTLLVDAAEAGINPKQTSTKADGRKSQKTAQSGKKNTRQASQKTKNKASSTYKGSKK